MGDENQHLKTAEVSEELNCCKRTVRNLVRGGKLPGSHKIGGTWRIPKNVLENYRNKQIEEYHNKIFGLDKVPPEWKENTERAEKPEKSEMAD